MDREEIIQKFEKLNVWKNGDQRAVHKPLLVLYAIGQLLRGQSRLISFSDVEEELKNLLKEFGPWRPSHRPQYPFWRLRKEKEKIWEIPDEHRIREGQRSDGKSTGDPKIDDLRQYGVGGLLEPIAYQFQENPDLAFEVAQNLLNAHFPISYHKDILEKVGITHPLQILHLEPRIWNFRENILKIYDYRCAVCGFDVRLRHQPVALEASHIKWHKAGGPDAERNGMALCSMHHRLFDRGVFTLSSNLEVLVSEYANGTTGFDEWLMNFHGKEINFPQRQEYYPNDEYLRWHLKEVFKGPYREKTCHRHQFVLISINLL